MEYFLLIICFFLLGLMILGIFDWFFAKAVRRRGEELGIALPFFVEFLLSANTWLCLLTFLLFMSIVFMSYFTKVIG